MQLFQDGQRLLLGAVLQNPLDNSAAIRVCGKHKDLKKSILLNQRGTDMIKLTVTTTFKSCDSLSLLLVAFH